MTAEKNQTQVERRQPLFRDLTAEDPEPEATEISSLCMNCGENGMTRLLLTKIPHYKEVVLMSFSCEHCGCRNNEIQNAGKTLDKGIKATLLVSGAHDLNRQVVKSDFTGVRIPKLDFEIPSQSQKGEVTTVEGIIDRAIAALEQDQPVRRIQDAEGAAKIDLFVAKMRALKLLDEPFTIIFEDISGNCYVENPNAPASDPNCSVTHFKRTKEQDHLLGIYPENEDAALLKPIKEGEYSLEDIQGEVLTFPTNCPNCNNPCETNMKMTNIPHFKEVVIMATTCETCGNRTNEVKSGSGIEPYGLRIEVQVKGTEDFSRDVLKSETCSIMIPELELDGGCAALGGRFTTVEGVIQATKEQIISSSALIGDSSDKDAVDRMNSFIGRLDSVLSGNTAVTLILDDPAGNSYVQSLVDDGPDERLKITRYERNYEQNEELGLNDMKVENYE
ncbi:zinc finger protein ZPR1 isoform X1 [Neodiprion pinetum]|uniref:zinc finger protein ZPR1 isoform X1 n=2 Tax=Neodiprion pinetum TaxID=441929 RepID=UPI001EE03C8F|nr:zinc finger protein ZPR1 isoform X1 [Neodiprion pinetum]